MTPRGTKYMSANTVQFLHCNLSVFVRLSPRKTYEVAARSDVAR